MGSPLGWEPPLPKGMTMPPGYVLCAEAGMGERRPVYYWHRPGGMYEIGAMGDDVDDKRKAVRQAWADYRSRSDKPVEIND